MKNEALSENTRSFKSLNMRCLFLFQTTVFTLLCVIDYEGSIVQGNMPIPAASDTNWYNLINSNLAEFNKRSATFAWRLMVGDDDNGTLEEAATILGQQKSYWKNTECAIGSNLNHRTSAMKRMYQLMCRGARYTSNEARELSDLMDSMSAAYGTAEVCVPYDSWPAKLLNFTQKSNSKKICLKGEPDLESLIAKEGLDPDQLLWIWKSWHDAVGPEVKKYYPQMVELLNEAANINGYKDIGEVWRDELEIPQLEEIVQGYYNEIEPLYKMLHAVVRHALYRKYGPNVQDPIGPIPAHLLGNMWAQDWSTLTALLLPKDNIFNLDEQIQKKNWSVTYMTELAEDMYISLGLPKMTEKFWKYSKFERDENNSSQCHGTAANMFNDDDYRILLCAKLNMEDFYVIHHELGHIEYYMAYKKQAPLFQDGANSAFQESIGDSIMTGVMVPQHLQRLGLISNKQLFDTNLDKFLLLQQALAKIPQIPYALLIDQYRWGIFKGNIKPESYNEAFWNMNKKLRGIAPPEERSEYYFDAGAKFHIPDNTPYIRYFLSAILQVQMFKGMCELTLYGNVTSGKESNIPFPLHRCDIYGSRNAGINLKKMMSLGASEHWTNALNILTGKDYITTTPLLEYYKPIYNWLESYIIDNDVYIGW